MKAKGIFTLTDEKLRCSAMHLGGIGTGTIALERNYITLLFDHTLRRTLLL